MNKTGKYKLCLIVFLIIITFLFFINSSSYKKAQNNCKLFEEFQNYIISNNWNDDRDMLFSIENNNEHNYSDNIYFYITNKPIIKNGKIFSLGQDVTDKIAKAEPKFWATYKYYRSQTRDLDKVMITNGYILLLSSKIIYIKIP
jgi:hypothetical protein